MADLTITGMAPASAKPASVTPASRAVARSPTVAEVRAAVSDVIEAVAPRGGTLEFVVDGSSGRAIVRVLDRETRQVVRQIPGEEVLAIRQALDRLQGILIRVKA